MWCTVGRLDLATPTPESVCVRNGDAGRTKMSIYGRLVFQEQLFVGAVRNGHDVDVLEFGARLAPVTVSKNVMPADFASGFHFATRRHGPMTKFVESRDTNATHRWLDVLQKRGKTSDDLSRIQLFGNPIKFIFRDTRFLREPRPRS